MDLRRAAECLFDLVERGEGSTALPRSDTVMLERLLGLVEPGVVIDALRRSDVATLTLEINGANPTNGELLSGLRFMENDLRRSGTVHVILEF